MKKATILMAVVLIGGAVGVAQERADEKRNPFQEYFEKFGTAGTEHKFMEPLVGTWHAKATCWMDPTKGPQSGDGTLVRKTMMDGRFIQENLDGKMLGKSYQGHGMIGYDRGAKKWCYTWLDNMSTAMHTSHGTYDESSKTWTFKHDMDCPVTGKHVKMRDTLRIVSTDQQQLEMYRQLGDEKETKVMEVFLTRK